MSEKTAYDKLVDWFDIKFGFAKTPLKPIPDFAMNPIYWLGLLLAVTFGLQALTGIFMLLYYVPTPAEAYSSTTFIINSVPLGHLTETFHLYTAYAMILLTFLHLIRNFFGSTHKGNRDLMWLVGIILALLVVGFGITGYLLPWTVISKSASDVAIGFINFLPTSLANLGKFVLVGSGSDASMLTTFLHIHTVFLPLGLIAFLALKIYMYEVHGPAYVSAFGKPKAGKYYRWFPKILLYAIVLFSAYIAILLALSSIFPLALPPAYSPTTAGGYVVQPDWYLLWVYQILKIQAFEGPEAVYALIGITILGALLFLIPFYDRSKRRDLGQRPLYASIGAILVAEFVTLTIWGYLTPGQVISNEQAAAVILGVALETAVILWIAFSVRGGKTKTPGPAISPPKPIAAATPIPDQALAAKAGSFDINRLKAIPKQTGSALLNRFTTVFVLFLAVASVSLASLVNMMPQALTILPLFTLAATAFLLSMYALCRMLRNYVVYYEDKVSQ